MGRVTKIPPMMSAKARSKLLAEVREAADEARGVNWQAYTALKRQEAELERENRREREARVAIRQSTQPNLTAAQAADAMIQQVQSAPRSLQHRLYLLLREIPGFATDEEDDEEDDGPAASPEQPTLTALPGGRRR